MTTREAILKIPLEIKVVCLENSLKENDFQTFLNLSKILLDTPIDQGGVSTEIIEKISQKYGF